MNLQTHMSGQFSGQVPNQAGTSLSGIPQQQNMMQNPGGQRSTLNMEPGFVKARRFIQERIYAFLMQRQQTQEIAQKKVLDIVKRLEEGLFKTATTKEEYMNLETLETRLHILIKRLPLSNQNQQYQQQANTSVPMGTMIPNPGMPQSGNSNIMVPSSMDDSFVGAGGGNSMMSSAVNTYAGGLTNGYQQPASNFSNNSGGNSMISSMGAQRMASQMILTPGFTNSTSTSNRSYMNMDSSNGVVGLSNSQAFSSTQCSNCVAKDNKIDELETRNKMLLSQNKMLMTRIKTLEASLELARNPEDHACQSGAMLHELLDEINNLHV